MKYMNLSNEQKQALRKQAKELYFELHFNQKLRRDYSFEEISKQTGYSPVYLERLLPLRKTREMEKEYLEQLKSADIKKPGSRAGL